MIDHVVGEFEKNPKASWRHLIRDLTEHLLQGRAQWCWKSLVDLAEPHLITLSTPEARSLVDATLQHVMQSVDQIEREVPQVLCERQSQLKEQANRKMRRP